MSQVTSLTYATPPVLPKKSCINFEPPHLAKNARCSHDDQRRSCSCFTPRQSCPCQRYCENRRQLVMWLIESPFWLKNFVHTPETCRRLERGIPLTRVPSPNLRWRHIQNKHTIDDGRDNSHVAHSQDCLHGGYPYNRLSIYFEVCKRASSIPCRGMAVVYMPQSKVPLAFNAPTSIHQESFDISPFARNRPIPLESAPARAHLRVDTAYNSAPIPTRSASPRPQ